MKNLPILLPYLRSLYQMYQHMHWKSSGSNYYGDHLLFERLYNSVHDELDGVAERVIGLLGPDALGTDDDTGAAADITKKLMTDATPDTFASVAIDAEMVLQALIDKLMDGETTNGLEDLLQGLASNHEAHVYLLRQRSEDLSKQSARNILLKVANDLDDMSLYTEADAIEKVMESLVRRVGIDTSDIISVADSLDQDGKFDIASRLDAAISKIATEYDYDFFRAGFHKKFPEYGRPAAEKLAMEDGWEFFDNKLQETYDDLGLPAAKSLGAEDKKTFFGLGLDRLYPELREQMAHEWKSDNPDEFYAHGFSEDMFESDAAANKEVVPPLVWPAQGVVETGKSEWDYQEVETGESEWDISEDDA